MFFLFLWMELHFLWTFLGWSAEVVLIFFIFFQDTALKDIPVCYNDYFYLLIRVVLTSWLVTIIWTDKFFALRVVNEWKCFQNYGVEFPYCLFLVFFVSWGIWHSNADLFVSNWNESTVLEIFVIPMLALYLFISS